MDKHLYIFCFLGTLDVSWLHWKQLSADELKYRQLGDIVVQPRMSTDLLRLEIDKLIDAMKNYVC